MHEQATAATSVVRHRSLRAMLLALAAALVLSAAGCATVGRDFPTAHVTDIRIGQTTQEQVKAMFGSPWRVGVEDGQATWTYGRYYYSASGQKQAKDLVVRFDKQGVVSSYSYSTTDHKE